MHIESILKHKLGLDVEAETTNINGEVSIHLTIAGEAVNINRIKLILVDYIQYDQLTVSYSDLN